MRAITASLLVRNTLQAITVPAYANVQGVTALEACTLQDGILVLAYPTCPYCRNLMPELLDAAEATDTSLYYCTLDKYRDVYTYDAAAGVPVLTTPAGEGYPELLVWLDEYTVDYTVTDSEGNALPVGEKRLRRADNRASTGRRSYIRVEVDQCGGCGLSRR